MDLGVVVHASYFSTEKAKAGCDHELEASLGYIMSSRSAHAKRPCQKTKGWGCSSVVEWLPRKPWV
jgi:hypothetical protein